MKCHKCGYEADDNAAYCNRCGARLNNNIECPWCHETIDANTVFCPKCGKMVRDDMHTEPDNDEAIMTGATATDGRQPTYNELHNNDRQQGGYYTLNNGGNDNNGYNHDDDDDDDDGPSHFNRNVLMGAIVLLALIALLTAMRHCNSQSDRRFEAQADSIATVADDSQNPLSIFNAELSRNNMTGDEATGAFAVKFDSTDPETPNRIVGVTYNNKDERPFIKIYQLTSSGSNWQPELVATKYLDGRTINLTNNALMADDGRVPRAVNVGGHECLFFAFTNSLQGAGEGNTGRATLALFDLENKKLTTLNYDGVIKAGTNGRQYIHGRPLESVNSDERRWLQQQVPNIKIIHVPTAEELQAEEEARLKAEEEKALAGEENADAKWEHDNAEKMDKLNEGEEVHMDIKQYDKPLFHKDELTSQIENDGFLVFTDKSGKVYGFNKGTRKYFVIYKPGASGAATGISFGGDGNLHISTASGSTISYNLTRGSAKHVDK